MAARSPPCLLLAVALACGDGPSAPAVRIADLHRFARFTGGGDAIVYYRNDERPSGTSGVYAVDLATGTDRLLQRGILAGLDVHPTENIVIFSARAAGEDDPALWTIGLDGSGLQRVTAPGAGHRWPAWSADGTRLAWEVRSGQTVLDTAVTLSVATWQGGTVGPARAIAPGRRPAWHPDGARLVVERRRPGGALPLALVLIDTAGTLLDTLAFGAEPIIRPDGAELAYLASDTPDRGCLGTCFVAIAGGAPRALSEAFASAPGGWSRDGLAFVYGRHMRTYDQEAAGTLLQVEETRLWLRTLASEAERQVTF